MPAVSDKQRKFMAAVEKSPQLQKKHGISETTASHFSHTKGPLPTKVKSGRKS